MLSPAFAAILRTLIQRLVTTSWRILVALLDLGLQTLRILATLLALRLAALLVLVSLRLAALLGLGPVALPIDLGTVLLALRLLLVPGSARCGIGGPAHRIPPILLRSIAVSRRFHRAAPIVSSWAPPFPDRRERPSA